MPTVCRKLVACALLALPLSACGHADSDPAAAAARAYDQALEKARKAMAEVAVADPAANRASAEALRSTANACKAPSGATNNQKAAFAMTGAQLLREAARLDTIAIERLQAQQRAAADRLVSALQAAGSLKQMKTSMPAASDATEALQKAIDDLGTRASDADAQAQAGMSSVQSKQDEVTKLTEQATALDAQAAQKRAEAGKAPTAQALKLIEEASALTKQAIELRRSAGAASLVATTSGPEAARQQRQAEAMREQQKRLEGDKEAVAAVGAARAKAAEALSSSASAAMTRANEAAGQLEKVSAELKTLFASAAEGLDQAASLAQQGSSLPGPQGSSAKMGAASAHLAQAMLYERWAMGASMEAYAFDAMSKAGGDSKWSKLASDARQERTDAGTKALAAFEAADGDIASDSGATLTALKARITEAKKAYETAKPAKAADAEPAKAAEGDAAKPAEGDAAKPAEGDAGKPADAPAAETKPDAPAAQPASEPAPAPAAAPGA